MITRAAKLLEKLFAKEPEKTEPERRRAPSNTTTSMRALTDLGDSIAASVHVIEASSHLYLCVAMEPKPDALAAQILKDKKQAAGMFEVDSTWSAAEVNKSWAKDAVLIDEEGHILFKAMDGARGMTEAGAKEVFFEFNTLDVYPEKVYLSNGKTRVRVM
ncbi:MAG: hypothetical protein E7321_00855 [Clostridiales bacterium]|nr:hypothetical protein [Clostridiales bacterium]